MKNLLKLTLLAVFTIVISSCSDDDDNNNAISGEAPDTIASFVADNADYSMLLAALQKTGLDVTLNGTDMYTVFAPNNAAFTTFLDGATLDDVPTDALTQLLLNHVLNSKVLSTELSTGYVSNLAEESTSVSNISMYIDITSGVVINGESTVVTADIEKSNGVIHAVNSVIALPTMLTFVGLDSDLSTLATVATTTDGFETNFAEVLAAEGSNLTLLAPDNDAFVQLGDISGESTADLEQILLNHVVPGVNVSSALTTSYANTLATYGDTANGLSIYINTDSGVSFNGSSSVSTADIVATNGVIHKVDKVVGLPTIVDFAIADPNFSTLVMALTTLTPSKDFEVTLATANGTAPAPFTVFAPVNTAFDAIEIPTDENDLINILNHHVIAGANVRSLSLVDGPVTTLNGDVTIDASAPSVTGGSNPTASSIIAVDVQASNGVIHAIDQVLLPAAVTPVN